MFLYVCALFCNWYVETSGSKPLGWDKIMFQLKTPMTGGTKVAGEAGTSQWKSLGFGGSNAAEKLNLLAGSVYFWWNGEMVICFGVMGCLRNGLQSSGAFSEVMGLWNFGPSEQWHSTNMGYSEQSSMQMLSRYNVTIFPSLYHFL